MEILITGSRGFIGTAIRKKIKFHYNEVDFVLGTDHHDVKHRKGILIFLSSWVNQKESISSPVKYIENNLTSLATILTNNNFDGVIFPSSYTVYDGNGNLEPNSVYGITKLAGEKLIKIYCKNYWIFRLGNPYGPNDYRSLLYELAKAKLTNKAFTMFTVNGVMRDYFHVEHVADIVNDVLAGIISPGIYNVGTGEAVVLDDFMRYMCEKHKIPHLFTSCPKGISDGYVPSTNIIKAERRNLEKDWECIYLGKEFHE